jgi:hypothetical protein
MKKRCGRQLPHLFSSGKPGRGERIRTSGLYVPNGVPPSTVLSEEQV